MVLLTEGVLVLAGELMNLHPALSACRSIHQAALPNSDKCVFFPTISRPMFPSNTTLNVSNVLLLTAETQQAVPLPFVSLLSAFQIIIIIYYTFPIERWPLAARDCKSSAHNRHSRAQRYRSVFYEQVPSCRVVRVRHGAFVLPSPREKQKQKKTLQMQRRDSVAV